MTGVLTWQLIAGGLAVLLVVQRIRFRRARRRWITLVRKVVNRSTVLTERA